MKSFLIFFACMILAFASFGFARYHYVEVHSTTASNLDGSSQKVRMTGLFISQDLIGSWVKDEWVFALAVPAVLIVGGLLLTTRR
jgi:hypothetical protein